MGSDFFVYTKDISYCVLCQQYRFDVGLLALILFIPVTWQFFSSALRF